MSEAVNERSGVLMSIRGVTKAFGSNAVLKGINMDVKTGEVIALIGGNGAGKSTLMKIIMGIYDLDEGEIFMAGQPVKLGKPSASLAQGIYLVPQEPMLFPNMTVLENVLMGFNENEAELKKRLQKHMEELGFTLNLQRKASTLSIAEQQLVEILRGLMREARLLILDEPTSALTFGEVQSLFKVVEGPQAQGHQHDLHHPPPHGGVRDRHRRGHHARRSDHAERSGAGLHQGNAHSGPAAHGCGGQRIRSPRLPAGGLQKHQARPQGAQFLRLRLQRHQL